MSLVIAGERSGVGKTTITLALLAALRRRGLAVQSFKVGPDYIDPMFHQAATGRPCRNLDPVLTSPTYVQHCFHTHAPTADVALIEGVMGLFDGVEPSDRLHNSKFKIQNSKFAPVPSAFGSTAHVAQLLGLPVLLVLDCRHVSGSIAAIVHGYQHFDPQVRIAGVVLNRVGSDRHLQLLTQALERLQTQHGDAPPVLGIIRRQAELTLPDRHLGLVPTAELNDLPQFLDRLADLAEQCFDWDTLLPLVKVESYLGTPPAPTPERQEEVSEGKREVSNNPASLLPPRSSRPYSTARSVTIAVAYDRAFSFYYADNWDLLRQLGADLRFWSPLEDATLPANIQGLYFGGGFPEMFARDLAANQAVRQAVRAAIVAGMPTYAECGGLMYLAEQLIDFDQQVWPMVGVLPLTVAMSDRLVLGYRRAQVVQDTPLLTAGTAIWGHEFHRSAIASRRQGRIVGLPEQPENAVSDLEPKREDLSPLWQLYSLSSQAPPQREGWHCHNLYATYLHSHWGAHPHLAQQWVNLCASVVTG